MKVAYQFSGEIRDFKKIFPNVKKNILDPTNADVYASVWEYPTNQLDKKRFKDHGTIKEFVKLYGVSVYETDFFDEEFLSGVQYLVDKAHSNKRPEIKPLNVISQYHKWNRCNYLRHALNHCNYDIVIKGRSEVEFARPLTEEEIQLAQHKILIPKGHDSLGINDIWAMGPTYLMDIYLSIIKFVDIYMSEGVVFHPETLLKYHLDKFVNSDMIHRFDFPLFLRGEEVTKLP